MSQLNSMKSPSKTLAIGLHPHRLVDVMDGMKNHAACAFHEQQTRVKY